MVVEHENERELGNDAFALKQYDTAILHYSKAIQANSTNALLYSNRSAAYLLKGWPEQALTDAESALALRCDWPKAHGRKAAALHALRRYEKAIVSWNNAISLDYKNILLQEGLEKSQKALQKLKQQLQQKSRPQQQHQKVAAAVIDRTNSHPEVKKPAIKVHAAVLREDVQQPINTDHHHININNNSHMLQAFYQLQHQHRKVKEEVDTMETMIHAFNQLLSRSYITATKEKSGASSPIIIEPVKPHQQQAGDDGGDDLDINAPTTFIDGEVESISSSEEDDESSNDDDNAEEQDSDEAWFCTTVKKETIPPPVAEKKRKDATPSKPTDTSAGLTFESLKSLFGSDTTEKEGDLEEKEEEHFVDASTLSTFSSSSITHEADQDIEEHGGNKGDNSTHSSSIPKPASNASQKSKPSHSYAQDMRTHRMMQAVQRRQNAEAMGEIIQETDSDVLSQSKRTRCNGCSECPGFKIIYRTVDANDPEVMFYCSLCGCSANNHEIDNAWLQEEEMKKRREAAAAQQAHNSRTIQQQYAQRRESEALALLGLSVHADKKAVARAFKKLALKFHPDRTRSTSSEAFVEITKAYEYLLSIH